MGPCRQAKGGSAQEEVSAYLSLEQVRLEAEGGPSAHMGIAQCIQEKLDRLAAFTGECPQMLRWRWNDLHFIHNWDPWAATEFLIFDDPLRKNDPAPYVRGRSRSPENNSAEGRVPSSRDLRADGPQADGVLEGPV